MTALTHCLLGEPSQRGREAWRFRAKGSLAVVVAGPKRGAWHDHEAGRGGDALGLIAHLNGQPMRTAFHWAMAWLGEDRREAPRAQPLMPALSREPPATLDLARRIWRESSAAAGSPVEAYLRSRGLSADAAPLRFHPACPRGAELLPAMISLMTDAVTGRPCGVHRTFLRPDGTGKADGVAKLMLGNAGVIRLTPDDQVTTGLGVAEGIETSLSVMQGFGWRPVWAATSAGAINRFPVLFGVEALTIFADPDGAGMQAARGCAARWVESGREARICTPPRGDFNDLIQERGE